MSIRLEVDPDDPDCRTGTCEQCGRTVERWRGQLDIQCQCGAIYNCAGQRLRDDLYTRPNRSDQDDDVSDLDGYEEAMIRAEGYG